MESRSHGQIGVPLFTLGLGATHLSVLCFTNLSMKVMVEVMGKTVLVSDCPAWGVVNGC